MNTNFGNKSLDEAIKELEKDFAEKAERDVWMLLYWLKELKVLREATEANEINLGPWRNGSFRP